MSNDVGTDEESGGRDSEAVRDDIMKRLLEYQRAQRTEEPASSVWATPPVRAPEAETAVEAHAPSEPEQQVPVSAAEPAHDEQAETMQEPIRQDAGPTAQPAPASQTGVESLRAALEGVRSQIEDLRQTFQDMAIAADERLAEIEAQIARAGGSNEPS